MKIDIVDKLIICGITSSLFGFLFRYILPEMWYIWWACFIISGTIFLMFFLIPLLGDRLLSEQTKEQIRKLRNRICIMCEGRLKDEIKLDKKGKEEYYLRCTECKSGFYVESWGIEKGEI